MNTHDKYELPPLPYPYNTPAYRIVGAVIQEYATESIEADRKRRGEPVAVIRFERNKPGTESEMPKVISCNRLPDGYYQVFLAPQPAEPVVKETLTVPDSWQLVPKEPTKEMVAAFHVVDEKWEDGGHVSL